MAQEQPAAVVDLARLELALAASESGIYDWDVSTGRLAWDERTLSLLDVDPDTWDESLLTFFEHVHHDDRDRVRDAIEDAVSRCSDLAVTYRVVRRDGSTHWLEARGRVLADTPTAELDGEDLHLRLVGIVSEVTERALREELDAARARSNALLAAASERLAGSLSEGDVLAVLGEVAVPQLGDWCALWVVGELGEHDRRPPRLAAVRHVDPGRQAALYARLADGGPEAVDETQRLVVPLTARGRQVAVLALHRREDGDLSTAQELGRRVALALDNAALFERQRHVAESLQRSLLPTLPVLDGVDAVARYTPGATELQVGGDWFDLVDLGAGRMAIVIGDVMGRGLHAAAAMGQLRAAVRAYAQLDLPPGEVLTLLDRLVTQLGDSTVVTCLFAVFDLGTGELQMASAGHFPPFDVTPEGTVVMLDLEPAPPLGSDQPDYEESVFRIPRGHLLAFFTDGLVESRGSDLDEGLQRVRERLAGRARDPLDEVADDLLAALGDLHDRDDDTALLLVRTTPLPALSADGAASASDVSPASAPLSAVLPNGPTAAWVGRRLLAEHVEGWELTSPALDTASLVLSELATNAMLHGAPPITVSLRPGLGSLFIEVADGGRYRPRRRVAGPLDEGGRGLELVQALSRRWGVRPRMGGKVVWSEIAAQDGESTGPTGE